MSLFSWLRTRTPSATRSRRTHRPARRPAGFRPQLESLDDRLVPSTLTVTNNLDSGAGSLRAEIAAANPGDTIKFASSVDGQTITLTSGNLLITEDLTIKGPDAGNLFLTGNTGASDGGVFEVEGAGINVTLKNLTICNSGGREAGGAIANFASNLTVTDCLLSGNTAASEGGAIYNWFGKLTVSGCSLSDNTVRAGDGGAIYNQSTYHLTITNSTLSDNSVHYDGAGENGEGGGLYTADGGNVTMTGCSLTGNSATSGGGGIFIESPDTTTVTISGCTLTGNSGGTYGGGICNWNNAALTVSDSVFSANVASTAYQDTPNIFGIYTDGGGNTFS